MVDWRWTGGGLAVEWRWTGGELAVDWRGEGGLEFEQAAPLVHALTLCTVWPLRTHPPALWTTAGTGEGGVAGG